MEDKYTLKVKDTTFTIPKHNIRLLAMVKATDLGAAPNVDLSTDESAINYLCSIGIGVM